MSMKSLFHLAGAISFAFGSYYDWNYVIIPPEVHRMGTNFAGKLKFLTYWDALLQTVYFTICVLVDITNNSKLRKLKNKMFASVAFPIALFVGLTFWAIYVVDRELVFPKAIDAFFPSWLNHLMHTNIMIFTVIEMITSYREYPTRYVGLKLLSILMLSYLIWMHIIYYSTGYWVYPILEVLTLPFRIVFFVVLFGFVGSLYILGEKFNRAVWGKHQPKMEKFH